MTTSATMEIPWTQQQPNNGHQHLLDVGRLDAEVEEIRRMQKQLAVQSNQLRDELSQNWSELSRTLKKWMNTNDERLLDAVDKFFQKDIQNVCSVPQDHNGLPYQEFLEFHERYSGRERHLMEVIINIQYSEGLNFPFDLENARTQTRKNHPHMNQLFAALQSYLLELIATIRMTHLRLFAGGDAAAEAAVADDDSEAEEEVLWRDSRLNSPASNEVNTSATANTSTTTNRTTTTTTIVTATNDKTSTTTTQVSSSTSTKANTSSTKPTDPPFSHPRSATKLHHPTTFHLRKFFTSFLRHNHLQIINYLTLLSNPDHAISLICNNDAQKLKTYLGCKVDANSYSSIQPAAVSTAAVAATSATTTASSSATLADVGDIKNLVTEFTQRLTQLTNLMTDDMLLLERFPSRFLEEVYMDVIFQAVQDFLQENFKFHELKSESRCQKGVCVKAGKVKVNPATSGSDCLEEEDDGSEKDAYKQMVEELLRLLDVLVDLQMEVDVCRRGQSCGRKNGRSGGLKGSMKRAAGGGQQPVAVASPPEGMAPTWQSLLSHQTPSNDPSNQTPTPAFRRILFDAFTKELYQVYTLLPPTARCGGTRYYGGAKRDSGGGRKCSSGGVDGDCGGGSDKSDTLGVNSGKWISCDGKIVMQSCERIVLFLTKYRSFVIIFKKATSKREIDFGVDGDKNDDDGGSKGALGRSWSPQKDDDGVFLGMVTELVKRFSSEVVELAEASSSLLDKLMMYLSSLHYLSRHLHVFFGQSKILSICLRALSHVTHLTTMMMTNLFIESMWSSEENSVLGESTESGGSRDVPDSENRDGGLKRADLGDDDFFKVDTKFKITNFSVRNWCLTIAWFNNIFDKYFNDLATIATTTTTPSTTTTTTTTTTTSTTTTTTTSTPSSSTSSSTSSAVPSPNNIYTCMMSSMLKASLDHYVNLFTRLHKNFPRDIVKMNQLKANVKLLSSTCLESLLRCCATAEEMLHPIFNKDLYGVNVACTKLMSLVNSINLSVEEKQAKVEVDRWIFLASPAWRAYRHPEIIIAHEMFIKDPIDKKTVLLQLLLANRQKMSTDLLTALTSRYRNLLEVRVATGKRKNGGEDRGGGDGGGDKVEGDVAGEMRKIKMMVVTICDVLVGCGVEMFHVVKTVAWRCCPNNPMELFNKVSPVRSFFHRHFEASFIGFLEVVHSLLQLQTPHNILPISDIYSQRPAASAAASQPIPPPRRNHKYHQSPAPHHHGDDDDDDDDDVKVFNVFPEDRLCCGCRPTTTHLLWSGDAYKEIKPEDMERHLIAYILKNNIQHDDVMMTLLLLDGEEEDVAGDDRKKKKIGSLLYKVLVESMRGLLKMFEEQWTRVRVLMKMDDDNDDGWTQVMRTCRSMVDHIVKKNYDLGEFNLPNMEERKKAWKEKHVSNGDNAKSKSSEDGKKKFKIKTTRSDDVIKDNDAGSSGGGDSSSDNIRCDDDDDDFLPGGDKYDIILTSLLSRMNDKRALDIVSKFIVNNDENMKILHKHYNDDDDDDDDDSCKDRHHPDQSIVINLKWNYEDSYLRTVENFNFIQ